MSSNWAVFVRLFTHREGGVSLSRTTSRKILLERSEKNILYFFINGIFLSTAGINKASDKLLNFSVFNRLWRQTVLQNLYKNTLRFIEILSSKNPIFYWSVDLFNFAFVVYGEFKTYQLHFRIQWGKELWIQLQPKVSFYPRWRRFPLHLSTYT